MVNCKSVFVSVCVCYCLYPLTSAAKCDIIHFKLRIRQLSLPLFRHPLIRYRNKKGLPIRVRTVDKGLSGLWIGLFLKGVICIDFAYYCKGIYDSIEGVANQDSFVVDVFKAAGSSYAFAKKSAYSASNYGAKLFNGSKPLSKKHRNSFPNPINTTDLAKYLSEHIKKESVRNVMNYFTIPTDAEIDLKPLSRALADQLQIIIHEPDSNLEIVVANYQKYMTEQVEEGWSPYQPLYDGDAFWVENVPSEREHSADFYECFSHTWKIMNSGKVKWTGRKLICVNKDDITPYAIKESIDIPDTNPNSRVSITVEFDARGVEDDFVSAWMIVDSEGRDCFPDHTESLSVTIRVENKSFKRSGGK